MARYVMTVVFVLVFMTACTTVGQIANLGSDPACGDHFEDALIDILTSQKEANDAATRLAYLTRLQLTFDDTGPRPFAISAPSGTDYYLLVDPKPATCTLRLYGRVRGMTRYTNNLTWIESRELPGCQCQR